MTDSNFLIAFSEYAPYSFLKGAIFLNSSTNDSSKLYCLAKATSACASSFLSSTEYNKCQRRYSIRLSLRNEKGMFAFFKAERRMNLVELHGYDLSTT